MDSIAGYVRVLASARVTVMQNKPFFGKPYLTLSQCVGLWSYFFQLGGLLAVRHSAKLDEFGAAFLGSHEERGAVKNFLADVSLTVEEWVDESTTITQYVTEDLMRRDVQSGDWHNYLLKYGSTKLWPSTAEEAAFQYAIQGAAFGTAFSEMFRRMIERSSAGVSDEEWERARTAGLNIPAQQEHLDYNEAEHAENLLFLDYCREVSPTLCAALTTEVH